MCGILTAWSFSVSSRRLLRHLAAASLFLSLLILLFSSSSGDNCNHENGKKHQIGQGKSHIHLNTRLQ